jgi:hypothetical protein
MKFFENIQVGKEASIFNFLKTKIKHREYIERPVWSNERVYLAKLTDHLLERYAKREDLIDVLITKS